MRPRFSCVALSSTLLVVVLAAPAALAEDISGTILLTKIIMEDSRLVGDVACRVPDNPCIAFGRSGIKLSLNGFTISGTGNPDDPSTCNSTIGNLSPPTDLVTIAEITGLGFTDVQLLGPGI